MPRAGDPAWPRVARRRDLAGVLPRAADVEHDVALLLETARHFLELDLRHSEATSSSSAATEGRSAARSSHVASAGHGSSERPSWSRARTTQGRKATSARPK